MLERSETLTHRIGVDGRVSVKSVGSSLRIRGIEGDEVRLTVTYRIRAGDQATAERALDDGRVLVDRGPGSLDVETPERRLATGLAWLFGGARVSADIALEVPLGARVRLETMSGSIEAAGLVGEQKYRTVSGDLRLWGLSGTVEAGAISGSIGLDNGGDMRLRATTISGSVDVRAARFHGLLVSTTSGRIRIVGALDPAGDYRAESISGSVELAPLSGVTAELRSVSGSMSTGTGGHVDGGRGSWRAVFGDGRATFRASSTSGSMRIANPSPADSAVRDAWNPSPTTPVPPAAPAPPAPPPPPAAPWESPAATPPADAAAHPAQALAGEPAGISGWSAEDVAVSPAEASAEDELAVLQALERGEIGVDEAAARLESIRSDGHV